MQITIIFDLLTPDYSRKTQSKSRKILNSKIRNKSLLISTSYQNY